MDWDELYRDLKTRSLIILFILAFISYFLMSNSITAGIILGGLIIIINFDILQSVVRRACPADGEIKAKKISLIAKTYFRLLVLGAIIYFLITRVRVDPLGLTVGLSTVVFSIVSFGISSALKTNIREAK